MENVQHVQKAIEVATKAHNGQVRKGTQVPYIVHPLSVYALLREVTTEQDVLLAGLLHDTIEDTAYSAPQMIKDFGKRVCGIVLELTKDDSLPSWQDRADAYLNHLTTASFQALEVCSADKLHNIYSVLSDYDEQGEALWSRFNAGKERQQWWYSAVHEVLASRLPNHPIVQELGTQACRLSQL